MTTQEKLARLHNYGTRYEAAISPRQSDTG